MAALPADLRLRRELIAKLASVLDAQMQREALTLRQAAEMLGVSHPRIADLLGRGLRAIQPGSPGAARRATRARRAHPRDAAVRHGPRGRLSARFGSPATH